MNAHKANLAFVILSSLFCVWITSEAGERPWYAGTWDSRYNPLLDHPRTVAIRMELLDKDTHIPISDVQVSLEGQYYQMWISQDIAIAKDVSWWNLFVDPNKREPQPKEFKLDAVSGSEGVAVFALQWQKDFPWDSYFDGHPPRDSKPDGSWTAKDSWMLAVDDIEKVQRLEIRHPRYRYIEAPLDFQHVVGLEQYLSPQRAREDKYKAFEQNWKNEIHRRNVKMFVLDLGIGFPEFKKQSCTRPEFFSRIRAKEYGEVYQVLENLPQWDEGKKCGPYFVYDLGEILLEPVASRVEVQGATSSILTQGTQGQGTPWYRQYSHQEGVADTGRREEPVQGRSPTTRGPSVPTDRQGREPSVQSRPSLKEILADPAKLRDVVQKATAMKNQLAVAGIRAVPLPDPDTGQMTTLDAYARKLAVDAGVGGSLGEDPVATAYMLLFDSNFLTDEARIIQLPDGKYGTLNEAIDAAADSSSGLDPEALRQTVTAIADLRQAQGPGEDELLSKAVTALAGTVSGVNAPSGGAAVIATTPVAQGVGPKLADGPSVSQDQALYCPELSMSVKTLTPALRKEYGLPTGVEGAIIVAIDAGAPAGHHNLNLGMVIYSLGRTLIADADGLVQEARRLVSTPATVRGSGRDQALLSFWHRSGTSWQRGSEMIWVVGKKGQVDAAAGQPSNAKAVASLPQSKTLDLGNGVTMEFVLIPAGTFDMGSPDSEKDRDSDEGPVRRVQITRPFYMGKYEVTQDQYMAVVGRNPSNFSGRNLPVEQVSWDEAVAFCGKIGGRLPTEAEWEYACRAGSSGRFSFGDSDSNLDQFAWYSANSGTTTHSVGQKGSNSFGLYDMHGNVWEWCQDWYAENYQKASSIDPKGPSSGKGRVLRGGSWSFLAWICRSAIRYIYIARQPELPHRISCCPGLKLTLCSLFFYSLYPSEARIENFSISP